MWGQWEWRQFLVRCPNNRVPWPLLRKKMKERKKNTAGTEKRQGGGDKFIVMFDGQAMCVAPPPHFFNLFYESGGVINASWFPPHHQNVGWMFSSIEAWVTLAEFGCTAFVWIGTCSGWAKVHTHAQWSCNLTCVLNDRSAKVSSERACVHHRHNVFFTVHHSLSDFKT